MAAMRSIFVVLLLWPCVCRAEVPFDAGPLVKIALRHQVPMPPPNAPLVFAHTRSWTLVGDPLLNRAVAIFSPAFLLEEKADGSIVILRGLDRVILEKGCETKILWQPFSAGGSTTKSTECQVKYNQLSAFVCAVQLAARGDLTNAQVIWKRFTAVEWWPDRTVDGDVADDLKNPRLLLGRCIFASLRHLLLQRPEEWRQVHVRMKSLFDDLPELRTTQRVELFNDLGATLDAAPPAPNSIEALLLDWSRTPNDMRHLGVFAEMNGVSDASARAIILQGFDAIPGLLALLNDRRISTHERPALMLAPSRILSVGELANDLLQEITGLDRFDSNAPRTPADFRLWWQKQRGQSEADFFASAVFQKDEGTIVAVQTCPARILARKFPGRLLPLFEQFDREAQPQTQPFRLAEALAESNLPQNVKVASLVEAAQRGSLEHKRCILQVLAGVDQRQCARLLVSVLAQCSGDCEGPYWTCPKAAFSHVVKRIEDDGTWGHFLRVARNSSVGLRSR
jgi:hypothetical protein